jgi:large repetitive protein
MNLCGKNKAVSVITIKTLILCLCLLATNAYAQITATTSSTPNTVCGGVNCNYTGPSILINEVMLSPVGTDGSIWSATCGSTVSNGCGEWIELYNPNVCQPVDVSCYHLGNYTTEPGSSPLITHSGGFTIPPGTIVPPGGFLVIRGPNAPAVNPALLVSNGGKTIEIVPSAANTCLGPSGYRLWFPNTGGWFAFYDNNGVVQDAIRFGAPPANDLAGQPCVANLGSCPAVSSLQSYNQIPAAKKADIYTPATIPSSWGLSIRRGVDGGNWVQNVGVSPTMGTCNSTCVTIPTVTCTGTATVNPTGGVAPYSFHWNDSQAQLTQTATALCGGTYIVTVTDNVGTSAQFSVTVGDPTLPTASISGTTSICSGASTTITFDGTPNATVTYTVNGGGNQTIVLDAAGVATLTTGALTANTTYALVSVSLATCSQPQSGSAVITISSPPTATISGTTTICSGSSTTITFNGTPNATVTYTINGGSNQTILLNGSGTATLNTGALNTNTTYSLVSVSLTGTPPCSQAQTGSAVVTISSLLSASISGTTSVCSGSATTITFNGTPNATIIYTVNGGANQTITLNGSSSATLNTGAITTTTTYSLVSVSLAPCSQSQTGLAVVSISPPPTATISGATTICSGSSSTITFSGTPNAIVTYTINGGGNQTIALSGAGSASLNTGALTADTLYSLVSASLAGTPACSQAQSGTATVSVLPLPIAAISGTTTICSGSSSIITFSGTPNATVTYTINGGSNQTITLNAGGSATLNTGVLTANTTYNLVNVALASCSQNQSGSAVVTVNALPVITNVPANTVLCSGDTVTTAAFVSSPAGANFSWTNSNPSIGLAASGVGTIPTFTASNSGPSVTATIIVAATRNNCSTTSSYTITVHPVPVPNPVIADYELCDYNNPGDQAEQFTLNSMDTTIANGQANVTIRYYLTQSDAQNQTSPLTNLYTNINNPQQIWINISDNTTGCDAVSSFNLVVNPLPIVNLPNPIFQCSNGATTQAIFDLTINEGVVTVGNTTAVTVSYYHSLLGAQNEVVADFISLPSAYLGTDNEIVYIRVEDNAAGCYATTSQLLRVTQGPVANNPTPLQVCDLNNDGFAGFDLTTKIDEITGGSGGVPPFGVSITFHETATDAQIGATPIATSVLYDNINPWTQTIYVRVYYTLTGCANYVQLQLIVNPTPEATEPNDLIACDYTGAVGYEPFNLTTTIPQVLGSINPADVTVTFHTTYTGAENETDLITGTTSYVNINPWNQTVYVRVEFITTGCYDIVVLNLIVNPLPTATQPNYPPYTLCDNSAPTGYEVFDLESQVNAILLGQQGMVVTFYPSLTDAQNGVNAINVSHPDLQYQNVSPFVQTLGIRITNGGTGCYVISTMDIRVVPLPSPIPPTAPYTICDDNQDGFAGFDLTTLTTDILQGANYIITYHETYVDATLGNNDIDTTVIYQNIDPFTQIIYVRAEDPTTGCVTVMPIVLNVNPSPIAPFNLNDIVVCDDDNNNQNAITRVDLTVRTADALAQQPLAPSNYTVTYYTTQLGAQQGIAPIIQATDYSAANNQTIWLRVEDNTTGCFNIGSFKVIVNIPLDLTTPTPLSVCDDDANPNDQHHSFDLPVRNPMITQNLPGYTVTYYPSYALALLDNPANAIATPTAYVNVPPAVQTLGVVVTSAAGCKSYTTLDIRVLPIPTPNTNPPSLGAKCDDNNPGDMMEVFDLTINAAYIMNGDPNLTLHYYHSQQDAIDQVNEIIPANSALVGNVDLNEQSVWIRVENNRVDYLGNHCYVLVEQPLTVNPLPTVVQPLAPYRMCDDDTDGFTQFDMTNPLVATAILGANQSPADFTITYYLTAAGANPLTNTGETPLPNNYTNISNPQDVYIRVVNNATGCVNATGVLTLAVEDYATATGPQTFTSCDDYNDPYDGVYQLDLTQFESVILNGQNPAVFLVSYYHSQADAALGINAIPLAEAQAYITQPDADQIWVKVENSSNSITPFCYALTTIDIDIERYPNPVITTPNGVTTICVDFTTGNVVRPVTLSSGIANTTVYTFEWYEDNILIAGATGPSYTVNTSSPTGATRTYTVHVTSNTTLACDTTSAGFDVIQSGQASIPVGTTGYTVTNAFSDSQVITVTVEGWGTYEYSLDDGPRQASNIFEDVSMGSHIIHVWDTEGGVAFSCDELVIGGVQVIDYPHYFTPNGDGIHDTWNIVGLFNYADQTKIYIFDRYGKLLKQISAAGDGWDGTYNGHMLPSTDYWFTVDYPENGTMKQFKAHFSLKR